MHYVYIQHGRIIKFIKSYINKEYDSFIILILYFTAASPAQRVFKISMLFPSSVLCNDAGQAVLRQKVRGAINQLNRDWNFCSYAVDGKEENHLQILKFVSTVKQLINNNCVAKKLQV